MFFQVYAPLLGFPFQTQTCGDGYSWPAYQGGARWSLTGKATDDKGECVSRNRSPWFSLGYLLGVALVILLIILLVVLIVQLV
jgi:hypothetical protein